MPLPFAQLFGTPRRRATESVVPRRTFADVVLPPSTRRALDAALSQVTQQDLIWHVQVHPSRTPLAADVDFKDLARRYAVSGGDIRNAVLKAALSAASAPGPDAAKRIHQRDLEAGIQDVIAGKRVMQQSLFDGTPVTTGENLLTASTVSGHPLVMVALAGAVAALIVAIVALVLTLAR